MTDFTNYKFTKEGLVLIAKALEFYPPEMTEDSETFELIKLRVHFENILREIEEAENGSQAI